VALAPWAQLPSPLLPVPPAVSSSRRAPVFATPDQPRDLFQLLVAHGTRLLPAREAELRAGLGRVAPELLHDLRLWMERGDLRLGDGPLARGGALSQAFGRLGQPLLLLTGLRDNLVHPEHALAARTLAAQAPQSELVVQRLEGFPEDAGHLLLQAPWAPQELGARIHDFLAEHP
jgi:pimeloyl-ACP methyl ester carboxylesterase